MFGSRPTENEGVSSPLSDQAESIIDAEDVFTCQWLLMEGPSLMMRVENTHPARRHRKRFRPVRDDRLMLCYAPSERAIVVVVRQLYTVEALEVLADLFDAWRGSQANGSRWRGVEEDGVIRSLRRGETWPPRNIKPAVGMQFT